MEVLKGKKEMDIFDKGVKYAHSYWENKIGKKIEARESSIADIKDNFVINEGMTIEIKRLETEIGVLQELLGGNLMKYIASVSFGKDSLAMLLVLLEKQMPLDEVIFYDTGMEFKAIYDIRDKVKELLEKKKIKYTELKPKQPFLYKMLEKEVKKRDGTIQYGYGLSGGRCRWGTSDKNIAIEKYLKTEYGQDYREYIGIASDETKRIEKERTEHKLLPLVDWDMTEKDCLKYCYEKGFFWEENGVRLYDVLDRVSCWCCANKNKKELENMFNYLPEYYLKNVELLKLIKNSNKKGIVVDKAKEQFLKMF